MQVHDAQLSAGAHPAPANGLWRAELGATVKLALPIALTQLGQVTMMTSDLILIGHLGDGALAAAALGQTVLFAAFVLGMGVVSAVAPLAAQAFGAREPRMVRRTLRVGLWAALMLGAPLTVLEYFGEDVLRLLGQDETSAHLAGIYLIGLGWSLVPGWWFIALRGFMGAVNRPEPALWVTLAAIPANTLLAYALIYGRFGLPELGHAAFSLCELLDRLKSKRTWNWPAVQVHLHGLLILADPDKTPPEGRQTVVDGLRQVSQRAAK